MYRKMGALVSLLYIPALYSMEKEEYLKAGFFKFLPAELHQELTKFQKEQVSTLVKKVAEDVIKPYRETPNPPTIGIQLRLIIDTLRPYLNQAPFLSPASTPIIMEEISHFLLGPRGLSSGELLRIPLYINTAQALTWLQDQLLHDKTLQSSYLERYDTVMVRARNLFERLLIEDVLDIPLLEKMVALGIIDGKRHAEDTTPLMFVIDHASDTKSAIDTVKFLLSHGADTSIEERPGSTALSIAKVHYNYFKKRGEDPSPYDTIITLLE